jgi:general secretion pathway protein F
METAALHDFIALNDQLAALAKAGVPLDTGLGGPGEGMTELLGRINAAVAHRVSRGGSVTDALDDAEHFVPPQYRYLVQLGLRSGDMSAALDTSSQLAELVDDSRHIVSAAFFYPVLVCCLAYAGLVLFCLLLVPSLTGLVDSLGVSAGPALHLLQVLRDSMAYWVAVPPIALLLIVAWRWSRRGSGGHAGRPPAWLPGMSRALFHERCASFSAALAALVAADVPLDEGLPLAAGASGDVALRSGAGELAACLKQGQTPGDDSPGASRFPPFLRWALLHSEQTVGRARALEMAASVYRQSALRLAERVRIAAPILVCVVIGGGVTLLYGLALFLPVVEMLKAVALPAVQS